MRSLPAVAIPLTCRMVWPIRNPAASNAIPLPCHNAEEKISHLKSYLTFFLGIGTHAMSQSLQSKWVTCHNLIEADRWKIKPTSIEMMRGSGCLVSDPPSMAMPRMVVDFRMTTSDDSSLDNTGRRLVYANQSPSLLSSSTPNSRFNRIAMTRENYAGRLRRPLLLMWLLCRLSLRRRSNVLGTKRILEE